MKDFNHGGIWSPQQENMEERRREMVLIYAALGLRLCLMNIKMPTKRKAHHNQLITKEKNHTAQRIER